MVGINNYSSNVVSGSPAAAAETVIATLSTVSTQFGGQVVRFAANVDLSPQAAVTAITYRIRRTSLTGTLVGTIGPIAPSAAPIGRLVSEIEMTDQPGDSSGPYVLTAQCTAGAAPSTVNAVFFQANVGG